MGNIPHTRREKLRFYEAHLGPWGEHAGELGLDPAMVEELALLTQEAREAFLEQQIAMQRARAATLRFRGGIDAMNAKGSAILKLIQGNAEGATGAGGSGENLYLLAQIDPPRPPSPLGPPGMPRALTCALGMSDGSLEIAWKCRSPRGATGTVYEVRRRLGSSGPFEHLGLTGAKRFVDDALPAGTPVVSYLVTARRGSLQSSAAELVVHLGALQGGQAGHVRVRAAA